MNKTEFDTRRFEYLQEKNYIAARKDEAAYLAENPGSPDVLLKCAWTSFALRRPDEAAIFENIADFAFSALQAQIRRDIKESNKQLINAIKSGNGVSIHPMESIFDEIIADLLLDLVPGWFKLIPQKHEAGDVVDLKRFGRFHIKDPLRVIEKRLCRQMPWEVPLVSFAIELARSLEPGAAFIDVGANIGCSCIPVARNFHGEVYGFEPMLGNFSDLQENIDLNGLTNITVNNQACGATEGEIAISAGPDNNPGMARVGSGDTYVKMVTLDKAFESKKVGLIKMDVEGFEAEVLKGAIKILKRDKPVLLVEILSGAQGGAAKILSDLGYVSRPLFRGDHVFYIP